MKKGSLRIYAPAILLSVLLTGCMGIKPSGSGDDSINWDVDIELDEDYTCELELLIPSGNSNETTMIDKLCESFNLKYPNITFKKQNVSVNNWEATVRNQNLAGTLPDIIWSNSPDFYYLVSANIAEPLDGYFKKSEEAGIFDLEEDYLKEFIDMGAMKGTHYLLPRSADSVVTFYNKKLLTDAGIDLSPIQNGWTWDTFEEIMGQYRTWLDSKGRNDWYCLDGNFTAWLSTPYPVLRSYGADVLNPDGSIAIDSQETRNALTMVRNLMTNKYVVEDGVTAGSSFEIGTTPFLFQSAAISLYAERRELKNNIDIVSLPLIQDNETPKIGAGIAGYAINKKSKEKTAAWAFLNHMMSKAGQEAMAEGGLNLPSIRKDLQLSDTFTPKWAEGYEDFNLSAYVYGSEYKITCDFLSYADTRIKADLDLAVKDLFSNTLKSSKTIEKAIKTCVDDIQYALDSLN